MPYFHYDRLTALDASFLALEDHRVHMHVGSVGLFELGPLRNEAGELDMARIRGAGDAALSHHPRFRQKLAAIPLFGNPVWVDDPHFNLDYHLRHTALPPPGDLRQLKRLTGRIMSQQLDRGKPLWELWFVEGLDGGGFAVITKVHHCMIDGISGVDLLSALLVADAARPAAPPARWVPRPAPSPTRLLTDELLRRGTVPIDIARGLGALVIDPRRALESASDAAQALGETLRAGLSSASATPLNGDIGPHRRFDWLRVDLDAVKAIAHRHATTLNDVVLATVSGAMRHFLRQRGEQVDDLDFRVMVPVNVRASAEHGRLGNRVSFLLAPLPVGERLPERRLERVAETMRGLKRSKQRRGGELLEEISDHTFSSLFSRLAQLGGRSRPYNLVVTNVPGPPFPVYLQGAPMREIYPLVPLFVNQGLGIALFSYDGGLFWGFNADWDAVPDLHDIVLAVEHELHTLGRVAGPAVPEPAPAARPHASRSARRRPVRRAVQGARRRRLQA